MKERSIIRSTARGVLVALIFHVIATTGATAAFAEQRCVVVNDRPVVCV